MARRKYHADDQRPAGIVRSAIDRLPKSIQARSRQWAADSRLRELQRRVRVVAIVLSGHASGKTAPATSSENRRISHSRNCSSKKKGGHPARPVQKASVRRWGLRHWPDRRQVLPVHRVIKHEMTRKNIASRKVPGAAKPHFPAASWPPSGITIGSARITRVDAVSWIPNRPVCRRTPIPR